MGVYNSAFSPSLASIFQEAISLVQQDIVMQNRPTNGLPWFRSASLVPKEPPPATQPTTRPSFRVPSVPPPPPSTQSQPQRTVPPPPNQSQMPPAKQATSPPPPETAPAPKPATPPPPSLPAPSVSQTPPQSPRVIKASFPTPPPSPKAVPPLPSLLQTAPKPSPPAVLYPEPEIKSWLSAPQSKGISTQHYAKGNENKREDTDNSNHKSANDSSSSSSSSNGVAFKPNVEENSEASSSLKKKSAKPGDENGTRWGIITIAGENIGAFMEVGSHHRSQEKKQPDGRHFNHLHGTKIAEQGQEGEGSNSSNNKEKGKTEASPSAARPTSALVNSNVQPINNSMVFNSSCIHRDPGVHITLSRHRQPAATISNHVHKDQHPSAK